MKIELEILNANFYENRKFYEDITKVYGNEHPKSIRLSKETEEIRQKLVKLTKNGAINS